MSATQTPAAKFAVYATSPVTLHSTEIGRAGTECEAIRIARDAKRAGMTDVYTSRLVD